MSEHKDLGEMMLELLSRRYPVRKVELGSDARLKKGVFAFDTEVHKVGDLGHLCSLRMKAMLGLMRMETVVLAVSGKDVPLLNLDWVKAAGKETQIVELYDTQLQPYPQDALAAFQTLRERDGELPDYAASGAHWYDEILYPCSYHKTGKGITGRLNQAARAYTETFLEQLDAAPACDPEAKKAKTRAFAENLLSHGGPAVDQVTKLFGRETAERLILRHMYGVVD